MCMVPMKLVSWPGAGIGDSSIGGAGAGDRRRRGRGRPNSDSGFPGGGEDGGDRKEDEEQSGDDQDNESSSEDDDDDDDEDDEDEDADEEEEEDDDDLEDELELLEDDDDDTDVDSDDESESVFTIDSDSALLVDSSDSSELQLWPENRPSSRDNTRKNVDLDSDTNFPAAVYSRDTLRTPGALTLVNTRGRTVWLGPAGRALRRHVRRANGRERNPPGASRNSSTLPVSTIGGETEPSHRRSGVTQIPQIEKCASSTDARDTPTSESAPGQDTSEDGEDTSDTIDTSIDSSEDAVDEDTALEMRLRSVFFN